MRDRLGLAGRRAVWALVVAVAAASIALLGAVSGSAATKTSLKGTLTTEPVTGSSCGSSVGICFTGAIEGKLKGTLTGTGTSVIPTADTPTTGVVLVTSDVGIQTTSGDLVLKDATVLRTTGTGEFSAIWTVIGGTGLYTAATGAIQVTGSFVPGGTSTATYVGTLQLS